MMPLLSPFTTCVLSCMFRQNDQIESICRLQMKNNAKMTISLFNRIGNTEGKGKKCWLPAFSPFPTVFSRAFYLRVVRYKSGLCGKELKTLFIWNITKPQRLFDHDRLDLDTINPLPDNKILDWSKLRQTADDKLQTTHLKWKISTILGRKHCEKRRNCLLQAISPFSRNVFHSYIFSVSKCRIMW